MKEIKVDVIDEGERMKERESDVDILRQSSG